MHGLASDGQMLRCDSHVVADHPAVLTVHKLKPGYQSLDSLTNDPVALTAVSPAAAPSRLSSAL